MPNIPTGLRETGKQQVEEGPEGGRKGDEEEIQEDLRGGGSKRLRGALRRGEEDGKEKMETAGGRRTAPVGPVCSSRRKDQTKSWGEGGASL